MTPSKASQHLDTSREGPRPEAVEPDQTLINSAPSLNEGRERLERLADGLSQPSFGISMTEEQALAHAADLRALLSDLSTLQQENGNLRRGLSLALEALERIKRECGMSREQFMMRGPAFACRQVEMAVSIARKALEAVGSRAEARTPSREDDTGQATPSGVVE